MSLSLNKTKIVATIGPVVSKDVFHKMDHLIFWKLWPWARRRHSNKSREWIARRYWRRDGHGWTFEDEGGARLFNLSRIPIERHIKVLGEANPYDPVYDGYFAGRQAGKKHYPARGSLAELRALTAA